MRRLLARSRRLATSGRWRDAQRSLQHANREAAGTSPLGTLLLTPIDRLGLRRPSERELERAWANVDPPTMTPVEDDSTSDTAPPDSAVDDSDPVVVTVGQQPGQGARDQLRVDRERQPEPASEPAAPDVAEPEVEAWDHRYPEEVRRMLHEELVEELVVKGELPSVEEPRHDEGSTDELERAWSQVDPPTMSPVPGEPDLDADDRDSAVDDSGKGPIILDQTVNLSRQPQGESGGRETLSKADAQRVVDDELQREMLLEQLEQPEEQPDSAVDDSGGAPPPKPAPPKPRERATDDADPVTPLSMGDGPGDPDLVLASQVVETGDRFAEDVGVDVNLAEADSDEEAAGWRAPRVAGVAAVLLLVLVAAVVLLTRGGDEPEAVVADDPTAVASPTVAVVSDGTAVAAATEEAGFQLTTPLKMVICNDGSSFSGEELDDGTIVDPDTGEALSCPGSGS